MKAVHRIVTSLLAGLLLAAPASVVKPTDTEVTGEYERIRSEAESYFAEASYSRAHRSYLEADALALTPEQSRWVDFRLADTRWRGAAASATTDSGVFEQSRKALEAIVASIPRPEDRDRVWAEAQESLGDFWWTQRRNRNWGRAWPHYELALDWWAGSAEIETARRRYLQLVRTMTRPREADPHYYYGYYGNVVPVKVLDNVLKIADSDEQRAHAHYLIAMTIRQSGGDWHLRRRVPEEFEAALAAGRSTDWYDDALFHYAEWMQQQGRAERTDEGQWVQRPDYVTASRLFERLLSEFVKGETRYRDQAERYLDELTRPRVGVSVSNVFLPGSVIQYQLNWRNVDKIDLQLYAVDLTRDVALGGSRDSSGNWLERIDLKGRRPKTNWSEATGDTGEHQPGHGQKRLDDALPVGAYVLTAQAHGIEARELILVTDASLVLKAAANQALVYFCDATVGAPIEGATVTLWHRVYDGSDWHWRELSLTTSSDGLAVFELPRTADDTYHRELFVSAARDGRQAFGTGSSRAFRGTEPSWRVYAFTDRPAYRPTETVQWKLVARRYANSVYSTPSGETLEYEILDPRSTKVDEGRVELNQFGSGWGSLELGDTLPLGEYRVQFWEAGRARQIGLATLFRLEEYKLPEFKVALRAAEENGKPKSFRLGQTVEVVVESEYYFGGPVANATVEVLVHQQPFFHWWAPPHKFPWFYEDIGSRPRSWHYGGGQLVKREVLRSDANGKVAFELETPANAQTDLEYRIEARVTDASRREIVGSDTIRVTRQSYFVHPHAERNVYRPQDRVTVNFKTLDANTQPVQVSGRVRVTRDFWFEVWIDPGGREVQGEELDRLRRRLPVFPPPPPASDERPWQLKSRGYEHDEILVRTLTTDARGDAALEFTPEREGFYRIAWVGEDTDGSPINAETTVWVATNTTTELGYRPGGLEIIVDRDTLHAGQTSPVMLSVPTNDRYVLFSVEAEDLLSYRLVHVQGSVKLLELEVGEQHVPNVFLGAAMVSDQQLFIDEKQVVVPPVRNFLDVELSFDRDPYEPRETGTLQVVTRDHTGNPVSAEVSLAAVDESVTYIQQDYAGDPRQFFFGRKRPRLVQTRSTFQHRSYVELVEGGEQQLIDLRGRRQDEATRLAGSKIEGEALGQGMAERVMAESADFAAPPRESAKRAALAPQPSGPLIAGAEPAVQVRSDFRSTVLWRPDVVTGSDGRAEVELSFPDSLTTWKATARVNSATNAFGIQSATTRTRKPLIVRLQAPRFFVIGDRVTVSAVINNNTDEPQTVRPSIEVRGLELTGIVVDGMPQKGEHVPLSVPGNGEVRVDWLVLAQQAGTAELIVQARGGRHADAMSREYRVYEHGIEKQIAKAGKLRADEAQLELRLPAARRPGSTSLTVQVAPSLAVTMLDALPYLIDYPYGCTEQTMSRFLPAAITAKTLRDLGLDPDVVATRLFGGIEPAHVDSTQPAGRRDLGELDRMVRQGLQRLYDFQHADGGWGWWKDGESDHFMTAYVLWGLTLARDAGLEVRRDVARRAAAFIGQEIVEAETRLDLQAWMLHALVTYIKAAGSGETRRFADAAFENLWSHREQLNAYTRALLALSAHRMDKLDEATVLVRNLENGVELDRSPDTSVVMRGTQSAQAAVMATAHWGRDGFYWRWSDGAIEATAFALSALVTIDPQHELIEPVTNWLIKNRRGAQWSNTRDTAMSVLALNEYLRQSDELGNTMEFELEVNGRSVVTQRIAADETLSAPSRFVINPAWVRDGANEIRLVRRAGDGPLYFSVEARFFSLEEPVSPTGNEIFVRRQYYKLVGQPTLLKGYVYEKRPLDDGGSVTSGDRVEVVLTLEAKNDYEYLVLEDLKPAGLEAVQLRSGEPLYVHELKRSALDAGEFLGASKPTGATERTGRSRWVYQELRDRKVVLFIDKLPQGIWELRYELRAETPGEFHALPVVGQAMYVPEIRANGAEARISVAERD
jgi:uncharacterized protein YfaS (alpha-2-macroglobulin family)